MRLTLSVLVCVVLLEIASVSCGPKAAIYVDNGRGQTAIDRMMTKDEKREIEMEILNLLGLPNRPRKINKATVKKSAPKFLMDIYRTLLEEEDDENEHQRAKRSLELGFSGDEQKKIDQSDVIMTFESINHHVDSVRHERGKRLWFDVSELPVAEDIVGAELRIYQNESLSRHRSGNFTVTAYQLIDTDAGENELDYISEINTNFQFSGWLGLNVTKCLSTWVAFPTSNKGIYLSVHPTDKSHEVRPEDIGLVTIRGQEATQPFMVAFLKASNNVKPRTTRDVKTRVKKSDITSVYGRNIDQESRSSCKINTLYISFKDLKWQDWIIAPEGYAAYFCHGECNFPLNAHMNASNHAIVQTLVHLMSPTKYPKSCCAPTKLSSISVLYFLDDHNVVLKKYKQMVVKTCGCR
ncbi:TGF-beta family member glass bottom boat isoform X1 [Rhynchophorus ferrugineus]|uniref:TGF-beta family member glass bottom boat isoform X1 n=2 Tax=Rhynchophorus ferrugineus TaxID=354439 RepID=UPI003FCD9C6E